MRSGQHDMDAEQRRAREAWFDRAFDAARKRHPSTSLSEASHFFNAGFALGVEMLQVQLNVEASQLEPPASK